MAFSPSYANTAQPQCNDKHHEPELIVDDRRTTAQVAHVGVGTRSERVVELGRLWMVRPPVKQHSHVGVPRLAIQTFSSQPAQAPQHSAVHHTNDRDTPRATAAFGLPHDRRLLRWCLPRWSRRCGRPDCRTPGNRGKRVKGDRNLPHPWPTPKSQLPIVGRFNFSKTPFAPLLI